MLSRSVPRIALQQQLVKNFVPRLRIFSGVRLASLDGLMAQCSVLDAVRGTTVVHYGAPLAGVLAIVYGSVKVAVRGDGAVQRVVSLVSAGQTFGEAQVVLGRSADIDAIALVDTKLVVIPAASILSLMEHEPRFARALMFVLAERSIELLAEVQSATQRSVHRLARCLVTFAETYGDASHVCLPVSKTLLAARIGVKKETLSRLLGDLARRGLIAVNGRDVTILDRSRLTSVTC